MTHVTGSFVRLESPARIVNNPRVTVRCQNFGISGVRVSVSDSWNAKFAASFS